MADIPRIVAINKSGESFISDNYVGDKLFFSDYEETQRTKFNSATPTPMPSEPEEKQDDFDLDSLL